MANRYKADLLIEYISIIFEEDNPEHLMSIGTYFYAVIERSPKKIQAAIENLEFTTKSKIMSTLTLLREEGIAIGMEKGREEGIQKGIQKGEYKKSVIAIRNMTLKKLAATTIAEFLSVTTEYVEKVQKELKSEAKIKTLLTKKQNSAQIAKKLKISEWLVEVIDGITSQTLASPPNSA